MYKKSNKDKSIQFLTAQIKELEETNIESNHPQEQTETIFECSHCDYTASTSAVLKRHITMKHRSLEPKHKISCNECGLKFTCISDLKHHMVVKHYHETELTVLNKSLARLKEDTDKFRKVEEKIIETEAKVSKTLKELDYKMEYHFYLNFQKLDIAITSDIERIGVKLEPVLQELGFTKPCTECWEVFKTDRQVKNHKKVKHVDEEE